MHSGSSSAPIRKGYDVKVEGRTYLLHPLSAMAQIRVARLLGPTLLRMFKDGGGDLLKAASTLRSGQATPSTTMQAVYPALAPILEALSSLSDEAVETIIKTVCASDGSGTGGAYRRNEEDIGVTPVWAPQLGGLAPHLELTGLGVLTLVGHCLAREFSVVSERYASAVGTPGGSDASRPSIM